MLCPVSSAGPNITLEGQYHCYKGPGISLHRLCDFTRDCPLGDDEGAQCREYHNPTEDQLLKSDLKRKAYVSVGLSGWRRQSWSTALIGL